MQNVLKVSYFSLITLTSIHEEEDTVSKDREDPKYMRAEV